MIDRLLKVLAWFSARHQATSLKLIFLISEKNIFIQFLIYSDLTLFGKVWTTPHLKDQMKLEATQNQVV